MSEPQDARDKGFREFENPTYQLPTATKSPVAEIEPTRTPAAIDVALKAIEEFEVGAFRPWAQSPAWGMLVFCSMAWIAMDLLLRWAQQGV